MKGKVVREINPMLNPQNVFTEKKTTLRVAVYTRVSTDHEEQQSSLAAQQDYYKKLIAKQVDWKFVKVYADEGISGLSTRCRKAFNQMIEDCLNGDIDLILTKSISRFARNTVDSINTIRKLKDKGIGVVFEKENINTLDSAGEFLLTLMSSLAQEESRSISENVTWGQRKRFADGKSSLPCKRFLGYDNGKEKYTIVVNETQAVIVRKIFLLFIKGYSYTQIANQLTNEHIPTPSGFEIWYREIISSILKNEKYKGDALLQKQFTTDYLTKRLKRNEGELPKYYIKDDHEAIISPWLFDYVQELIKGRYELFERYNGVSLLSNKIKCGVCNSRFARRPWHSTSYNNNVWQCSNRVKKDVHCMAYNNLYDKLLYYIIHDVARLLVYEKGVHKTLYEIIKTSSLANKLETVEQWFDNFEQKSPWAMLSDIDDLSIIIKLITVMQDGKLQFVFLDEKKMTYKAPKYSPKRGIRNE